MELAQKGKTGLQQVVVVESNRAANVHISVRDIRAIQGLTGTRMAAVKLRQFLPHAPNLFRQRRRLGQTGHRFDHQMRHTAFMGKHHQLFHVAEIGCPALRLGPHPVTQDCAGVMSDRRGTEQRPDFDITLEIAAGDSGPFWIVLKEAAQFPMCREQACDLNAELIRLPSQPHKPFVR